jgi:branched-subunit amino acid permease
MPRQYPSDSDFLFGLLQTIFAALAFILGCLTFAIGIVRLKEMYRRHHHRHRRHDVLFELEAQLPEV